MSLTKPQVEVIAEAIIASTRENRQRLYAGAAKNYVVNSPRLFLYSSICFFAAGLVFGYLAFNRKPYGLSAGIYLLTASLLFVAFLAKRKA